MAIKLLTSLVDAVWKENCGGDKNLKKTFQTHCMIQIVNIYNAYITHDIILEAITVIY